MAKVKTKKIVAKRFKVTAGGKVLHRSQGGRHLRRKKDKSRQRRQNRVKTLTSQKFERVIKRFLSI